MLRLIDNFDELELYDTQGQSCRNCLRSQLRCYCLLNEFENKPVFTSYPHIFVFPFVGMRKGNVTEVVISVGVHIFYIPSYPKQCCNGLIN